MTAPKQKFIPKPREWTDAQVAARLNMGMSDFEKKRDTLYMAGMPRPDPLFGNKTDSKALEHWLDMRSRLVDPKAASNENPPDLSLEMARRVHGPN